MFLGNRLKELRNKNQMTQEELGKLVNVTKVSICCYEKGIRTPSLETLDDLSQVFGVDANYFLGKDKFILKENTSDYGYYLSNEELEFIKTLKLDKTIYNLIIEDPKRVAELVIKRLK